MRGYVCLLLEGAGRIVLCLLCGECDSYLDRRSQTDIIPQTKDFSILRTWISILIAGWLLVGMACAALRICPACAYEASSGDVNCDHCGKALPRKELAHEAGSASPSARGRGAVVASSVVIAEGRLARKYLKAGQSDLALFFARNALALETLTARDGASNLAKRAAELVEEAKSAARMLNRPCRKCEGSGKMIRETGGLTPSEEFEKTFTRWQKCSTCGGRGYEVVQGLISDQMVARGKALRSYEVLQRGRKYVNIGNAWVPADVAEALSVRQMAMVLSATGSPCEDCQGFGRLDCDKCGGRGVTRCRARGCEKGQVEKKRKGDLVKDSFTLRKRCTTCDGRGIERCEECDGRGSILCDECQGRGDRELCKRCNGQGAAPCTRCKGVGRYRGEVCPTCSGEGVELCRGCGGDGRKR